MNSAIYKSFIIIIICIQFKLEAKEPGKYWVFFTNKTEELNIVPGNFSKQIDYYDIQVNNTYINALLNKGYEIKTVSDWLNAAVIYSNDKEIENVKILDFVSQVEKIESRANLNVTKEYNLQLTKEDIELLKAQTEYMGASQFKENYIDGSNIKIAVFDAGFMGVDKSPVFQHLFDEDRILATFDFVKNKEFVYGYNQHGTMVLSCIAGKYNNINMGLATGAQFLLARTEEFFETVSEEENWVTALEWAYKNGVKIVNSSLGYTYHKYYPYQMDGKTSIVSKAADIALKKGILIVNAAGNDGDRPWHIVSSPGDVENVLTVGGIDPKTQYHIKFSSYGPTADFRLKPNVCAFGEAIVANSKKIRKAYGTSFATPLISGFTACVWQMFPKYSAEELFIELQKSANLYPYYDYAHGYGTPQAEYFFSEENKIIKPTFSFEKNEESIYVTIADSSYLQSTSDYLYYKIEDTNRNIKKYAVIKVSDMQPLIIRKSELQNNDSIVAHYKRYTYGISNK